MDVLILGSKSAIAVMLLVAAGAKLSDPEGFVAAVRLFVPLRTPARLVRAGGLGIALLELALGAASLSSPAAWWLNRAIFGLACAFVIVSAAGFAFHRGRACLCFGALSRRSFDAWSIVRSVVIAAGAAVAMLGTSAASVQVEPALRVVLLFAALLVALAASTAARALAVAAAQVRPAAR
jgi:hypothetical protein